MTNNIYDLPESFDPIGPSEVIATDIKAQDCIKLLDNARSLTDALKRSCITPVAVWVEDGDIRYSDDPTECPKPVTILCPGEIEDAELLRYGDFFALAVAMLRSILEA